MRKVWFRVMYMVGGAWTDGLKIVSGRHGQEDASRRVFGALPAGPMAYIVCLPACLILLWAAHGDQRDRRGQPGVVSRPSIASELGSWEAEESVGGR